MGAFAFEIPSGDLEVAERLIAAVPPNWSWIDGQLDAPLEAIAKGKVAPAGYRIDRFDGLKVYTLMRVGRERWFSLSSEERATASMYEREGTLALIADCLLPLFIQLNEAGFDQGEYGSFPFESGKSMSIAYVRRGYLGDLFFHSDCYDNCGSNNPERCDIHLAPYTARWNRMENMSPVIPMSELVAAIKAGDSQRVRQIKANNWPLKPQFPALIKVEWEKKYGGRKERVAGILDACRDLGLKELDPEPIDYGTSYAEIVR